MSLISRSRPSPAMVVAVIALTGAFAGTAIAGPDAITSALNKAKVKQIAKKQGKKQANKQIRKKAPGLSVANAVNAQNATNATTAGNGARGFARVRPNGQVRAGAFGVNNLVQPDPTLGLYCEDTAFQTASLTAGTTDVGAIAEGANALDRELFADFGTDPSVFGCSATDEWVYILDISVTAEPSYFTVVNH